MSLNLKSISELQTLANSDDISSQISALSATDAESYIEVSYKNSYLVLSSYKFDLTKFMRFIINSLTDLSTAFDDYMTKAEYREDRDRVLNHLSGEFLLDNYVYVQGNPLCINSTKNFTKGCEFDNITVDFFADLNGLSAHNMSSECGEITLLNTNELTCSGKTADLTAQYALWN